MSVVEYTAIGAFVGVDSVGNACVVGLSVVVVDSCGSPRVVACVFGSSVSLDVLSGSPSVVARVLGSSDRLDFLCVSSPVVACVVGSSVSLDVLSGSPPVVASVVGRPVVEPGSKEKISNSCSVNLLTLCKRYGVL